MEKSRNEIDNNYKWDLTRIYKSQEDFEMFRNKTKELEQLLKKKEVGE